LEPFTGPRSSGGTRLGKDYARNKGTDLKHFTKLGNTWYRADRGTQEQNLKSMAELGNLKTRLETNGILEEDGRNPEQI
jgi:hypothetical protein